MRYGALLWFVAGTASAASCPAGIGAIPVPLPPALAPAFLHRFAPSAPAAYAEQTGFVRCAGGTLLACGTGANLPCGKADTRTTMPAATAWCTQHPGSAFIPAYVTGHATLYAWRCTGAQAVVERQVAHADTQGYVAEYWKPLD